MQTDELMVNVNEALLYVHHIKNGEGRPTIVFLHDSLGCTKLWRDFPQQLGQLTKCNGLIYDRQGYGKSMPFNTSIRNNDYMEIEADTLLEVLKVCGIDNAILFAIAMAVL